MGTGAPVKININFKKSDQKIYVMSNMLDNSTIKNLFIKLCDNIGIPYNTLKKDMIFQFKDEDLDTESNDTLKKKKITDNSTIIIIDGNQKLENNKNFLKEGELIENEIHLNFKKKRFQNNKNKNKDVNVEQNINETIKDMAILGCIQNQKIVDKKDDKEYISTSDALKEKGKNDHLFVLGLIASYLEQYQVLTVIENSNKNSCDENNQTKANNFLQILVNGMMLYKKYYLTFDYTKEKIENLEKLKQEVRSQISKQFILSEKTIEIYDYPNLKENFKLIVFIKDQNFSIIDNEFRNKLYPKIQGLVDVKETSLMDGIILNKFFLDERGDNRDGGWGFNEKRGNEDYYPPQGWIRVGVSVYNQYDNRNNDWLSYEGGEGEWCIAYHGIDPKKDIELNKKFSKYKDIKHPGQKIGRGVFCVQNPENLEKDCGEVDVGNEKYAIAFMLRVKPNEIRIPEGERNLWVLNGIPDELRPYGILFKKKN